MTEEQTAAAIKVARDAVAAALKKIGTWGANKGGAGVENNYVQACLRLSRVDPTFKMPPGQK